MQVIHTTKSIAQTAGGVARVVISLCEELATGDDTVNIVTTEDSRNPSARNMYCENSAVQYHVVTINGREDLFWRMRYLAILKKLIIGSLKLSPDLIVHVNGLWDFTGYAGYRAASAKSVPYVISTHGMLDPWSYNHKNFRKKVALSVYQNKIIENSWALIANSELEENNLRNLYPSKKVFVIDNGVKPAANNTSQQESLRENIVLFMSRLHPIKNIPGLLEAWALLKRKQAVSANWKLIIAGPDENNYAKKLVSQVEQLGLFGSVEFVGNVLDKDKNKLFGSASIFILPSYSENFGLVVVEALMHQLPVIASKGTPWDCLESSGCGWHVETSATAIAEALEKAILVGPKARANMGAIGRKLAYDRFTWGEIAKKMRSLYKSVSDADSRK